MIGRREFITLIGGAAAWPIAARTQQAGKVARIGFLGSTSASAWTSRVAAFRSALRDLGYIEGETIVIEFRWAEENYDRLARLLDELIALKIDVLVTYGTPATIAAKRATTTIPIVTVHVGDAIAAGIIDSLARPGGNLTGTTYFVPELMAKRLEILKDILPSIRKVALLIKPDNPAFRPVRPASEAAAKSLQIELPVFEARGMDEFEAAFLAMAGQGVDAVVIAEDAVFVKNARTFADLARTQRLPSAGFNELAEAGGLIGYGVDFLAMYRRAGLFVDKILKGAKPADIPVERPTKFELVINLKTARTLGLDVPPTLLARADEVIE
jgi:putative ABC transport system substrate-binding protein